MLMLQAHPPPRRRRHLPRQRPTLKRPPRLKALVETFRILEVNLRFCLYRTVDVVSIQFI